MKKETRQHIDRRMEALRQARRKRNKRRLILTTEILAIGALSFATFGMFKYSKFNIDVIDENSIRINEGAQKEGYTTIALFGGDSRSGNLDKGSHADAIIIVSINNISKDVNIASVYRDTLTLQEAGYYSKINNAYYVGGPSGAINVLNINYDMDIMDYATVDFSALTNAIDLLGGVELEISEAEMNAINDYVGETAKVSGVASSYIKSPGLQLLDGAQAVTYARIRKNVGEDYGRTSRQRELIEVLLKKINVYDLKTVNELIDTVFGQISTSFTVYEILELASGLSKYNILESTGYPFDLLELNLSGIGSTIVPDSHLSNVEELHAILYPEEVYTPSDQVLEINENILDRVESVE